MAALIEEDGGVLSPLERGESREYPVRAPWQDTFKVFVTPKMEMALLVLPSLLGPMNANIVDLALTP